MHLCLVLQSFSSHSDETDPERIKQIMFRALEDMEWLVKKVSATYTLNCFRKSSFSGW